MRDKAKTAGMAFIRAGLEEARAISRQLPTIPKFVATPGRGPNSTRIIESTQPNWWQLSQAPGQTILESTAAKTFIDLLKTTPPFCDAIGNSIICPGITSSYGPASMAKLILVSYLFASPSQRWQRTKFNEIWGHAQQYFDANSKEMNYTVFAPIYGISGIRRRIELDNDLSIVKLKGVEIAELASRSPQLIGTTMAHQHRHWTSFYLVSRMKLEKIISTGIIPTSNHDGPFHAAHLLPRKKPYDQWFSRINEETACLRAFLRPSISIPNYEILRMHELADVDRGMMPPPLPWRPDIEIHLAKKIDVGEIRQYRRRRAQFLALHGHAGWAGVAASMRRYALAWENPFKADTLSDIVAALERLIVAGEHTEVGYKLRVRTAHWIATSVDERRTIVKNIREAYEYRSGVAHGGFLPDHYADLETARRLGYKKSGSKHPAHVIGRIQRLTTITSNYYRQALAKCVDRKALRVDWERYGL